jgi:hypothetical protein
MKRRTSRVSRIIRITAAATIVFGPLAAATLNTGSAPAKAYRPVSARDSLAPADTIASPAAAIAAEYLSRRKGAVDRALPEGSGGTHIYEDLDGNAGVAFLGSATIGLSVHLLDATGSVEIHERAHLIHHAMPNVARQIIASLAPPLPQQHAAENWREHFASMAERAWEILHPPESVCLAATPVEQLRMAEESVPGSAGFMRWFVRDFVSSGDSTAQQLLTEAELLSAAQNQEWNLIFQSIEERRQPDGTFRPWPAPSVLVQLEAGRDDVRTTFGWAGPILSLVYVPSILLAKLFG